VNPIIQEEVTGCAIACAAVLSGKTYAQAKRIANGLGIRAEDSTLWSDTRPMRRLLNHLGFRIDRERPFANWDALPDLALLAIKWHMERERPCWHWVVFVREHGKAYVLDSKKCLVSNVRTDFGRMKPKWYMAINVLSNS
jgi:hypothetical protein